MNAFLVKVLIAALTDPRVEEMIGRLLAPLLDGVRTDLKNELGALEGKVLDRLSGLPQEILGDATKDVQILLHEITGTTDDIAGKVREEVSPLFDILNPSELAKKILTGMTGGGGDKPPWWPF